MSEVLKFRVGEEYDGKKAGVFLRTFCFFSARTLALLKSTEGSILRNNELLRSIDILHENDEIVVTMPSEVSTIKPIEGRLNILYEDAFLLILNKPPSTPVHPVKKHQEDTLANYVAFRYNSSKNNFVFRAVNRLDSDTSGIVIVARDRHTASLMQKSEIKKHYVAVCHGVVSDSGTIDLPMSLRDDSKIIRTVRPDGKKTITHYKPIKIFDDRTLLELTLETGRTHQIRCHLSHIGHPLMGDDLYGGSRENINRQALHCSFVSFIHPYTKEKVLISAPVPEDIQKLIKVN